ncbi:hypothetical protein TARUN_9175 [Trichoderma arundinaceum]|uniref:Uncharacterized protein n=1 Tax=Trichoderma arundinaceum TaxID=490622 RepID=A0A395NBJ9_TRIAR|nr:hypothetical protein TARUN_9175 [Trichoderma arundinaceum]
MGRDHADGRLFSRRAGLAVARVPEKTGPPKRHNAQSLLGSMASLAKWRLCSAAHPSALLAANPTSIVVASPSPLPNNSQPVAAAAIALAALNLRIPTASSVIVARPPQR